MASVKTVWIVERHTPYEGSEFISVFSSMDAAVVFTDRFLASQKHCTPVRKGDTWECEHYVVYIKPYVVDGDNGCFE